MNKKFLFMAACCCGGQALNAAVVPDAFDHSEYNANPVSVGPDGLLDISSFEVPGVIITKIFPEYMKTPSRVFNEFDIHRPIQFNLYDGRTLQYSISQVIQLGSDLQKFKDLFCNIPLPLAKQIASLASYICKYGTKNPKMTSPHSPAGDSVYIHLITGPKLSELDKLLSSKASLSLEDRTASTHFILLNNIDYKTAFATYADDFLYFFRNLPWQLPSLAAPQNQSELVDKIFTCFTTDQVSSYLDKSQKSLNTTKEHVFSLLRSPKYSDSIKKQISNAGSSVQVFSNRLKEFKKVKETVLKDTQNYDFKVVYYPTDEIYNCLTYLDFFALTDQLLGNKDTLSFSIGGKAVDKSDYLSSILNSEKLCQDGGDPVTSRYPPLATRQLFQRTGSSFLCITKQESDTKTLALEYPKESSKDDQSDNNNS